MEFRYPKSLKCILVSYNEDLTGCKLSPIIKHKQDIIVKTLFNKH